jgi:O-antigen ligase
MMAGFVSLFIILALREPLPGSVWFAVVFNIFANISQVVAHGKIPIIGEGLALLFHWLSFLIMICFLVQNSAAEKRVLVFFAVMIILAVIKGGLMTFVEQYRLTLVGVAAAFGNANALAHMSVLFAVAALFWSLRSSKSIKPLIWLMAGVLIIIMVRTISRGAMLAFGCGCLVLIVTVMIGKGVRAPGIILTIIAVITVLQFGYLLSRQVEYLKQRYIGAGAAAYSAKARLGIYSLDILDELWETKLFGRGTQDRIARTTGKTPHNTFLYAHLVFGGMTGWTYLLWLLYLGRRIFKMFRAKDFPLDTKMQVLALFGMSLASQLLSNQGQLFYSSIFAAAIVEKYTSIYSRRSMRRRWALLDEYEAYSTPSEGQNPEALSPDDPLLTSHN